MKNYSTIKIWNPNDESLIRTLLNHSCTVLALIVLSNGNLASGLDDNTIKIWNPNDGSLIRTLSNHTDSVEASIDF